MELNERGLYVIWRDTMLPLTRGGKLADLAQKNGFTITSKKVAEETNRLGEPCSIFEWYLHSPTPEKIAAVREALNVGK